MAVDSDTGNLYAVWMDGRFSGGDHDDIDFSMSTDWGADLVGPGDGQPDAG
jgi:hypothetical protein